MPPLRIGLIGCGKIAQAIHLRLLAGLPGVELAALAETDAGRRAAAARAAPGAALFADYHDLLESRQAEAVVICLPTSLHAEAAQAAFDAGLHVYLEKPLADSLGGAGRILAAWRRSGRAGMIGFNYRFHPLVQALRRDLQAGRIGPPTGAQTVFATAGGRRDDWRRERATGGGVLLDLASHHIDLARWLFGAEVAEVFARLRSMLTEDDSAALGLRLANGVDVQTLTTFAAVEEDNISVYGPRGKLRVDRYRGLEVEFSPPKARRQRLRRLARTAGLVRRLPFWLSKMGQPGHEPSYRLALAHFCQAVAAGRPPSPDLVEGYRCLAVVAAAELCARTGRPAVPDDANTVP